MTPTHPSKSCRRNVTTFVVLFCLTASVIWSQQIVIDDRSNQRLSNFPHNSDITVTDLKLDHNYIHLVDYLDPLPALSTIILDFNDLTTFPDFTNVSSTLLRLYLSNNKLTYIYQDYLEPLVALQVLSLDHNQLYQIPNVLCPSLRQLDLANNNFLCFPDLSRLGRRLTTLDISRNSIITEIPPPKLLALTELKKLVANGLNLEWFPDVRPISRTLEWLELRDNSIHRMSGNIIVELVKLTVLRIDYNNIQSLPNICMKRSSSLVSVSAMNNPIRCDHTARWMKIAEEDGLVSISLKCNYPPKLNGISWTDINMNNLTQPTGSRTFL